jgi:hypothetical protein
MRLQQLAKALDLEELTPLAPGGFPGVGQAGGEGDRQDDPDITQGYASDLLSDVLANAPTGGVLVTLQVHLNVIAVAGHAGLRAVIFSSGRRPEAEVIAKAAEEGLILFSSAADTFELTGRLYQLGIRGGGA